MRKKKEIFNGLRNMRVWRFLCILQMLVTFMIWARIVVCYEEISICCLYFETDAKCMKAATWCVVIRYNIRNAGIATAYKNFNK